MSIRTAKVNAARRAPIQHFTQASKAAAMAIGVLAGRKDDATPRASARLRTVRSLLAQHFTCPCLGPASASDLHQPR